MSKSLQDGRKRARAAEAEAGFTRRFTAFLVALLLVVVCLQVLLRFENIRRFLNESIRLEGMPLGTQVEGLPDPVYPWLDWQPGTTASATIYIRLLRRPAGEVWVLVNGRAVRAMDEDGAALAVRDGDRVEVLCTRGTIDVMVSSASSNLQSPPVGMWAGGSGTIFVCQARLK